MVSRLPSALLYKINITTQKQKNITERKPSLHLYCDSYLYSRSLNCCGFQGDVFKNCKECPAFPDHVGELPHSVPSHVMTVHPFGTTLEWVIANWWMEVVVITACRAQPSSVMTSPTSTLCFCSGGFFFPLLFQSSALCLLLHYRSSDVLLGD